MIPNILHFIFGLEEDYGGKSFSFIHFLSVFTAFKVHRPKQIYFHYEYEPTGKWWEMVKPYLTLNKIKAPTKIFGNEITRFEHKADVVRLEILMQHGGIYLDTDVISINPLKPLLKYDAVLGIEYCIGLCNAVILAKKESEFISLWYDQYKNFYWNQWNYHSVKLPLLISKQYPFLVHVVDKYSFFFPMYDDPSHHYLWNSSSLFHNPEMRIQALKVRRFQHILNMIKGKKWQYKKLCNSYCIHLWESQWFAKYLQHMTPDMILNNSSNLFQLIRRIVTEEELLTMRSI